MTNEHPIPRNDYFVTTALYGRPRPLWMWEIRRRSKPLAVKIHDDDFKTEQAAKLAGEKVLQELLDGLAKDRD